MRRNHSGFTLLEIMVVVMLIALTVTLVGVNLSRDLDQVANLEAQRFAKLLAHVRDESVLTGKIYAIEVNEQDKTYHFLESPGDWSPVTHDDILRQRHFPEYLSVRFDLLQRENPDAKSLLIVQGDDEITPFNLVLTGDKYLHIVALDEAFNVSVERVEKDES